MENERKSPDEFLKEIQMDEEQPSTKGKLKVFFGYCAGVGKTYAMLEAAHIALAKGIDVVAGYIEPHARPETAAMMDGLECIEVKELPYHNVILKEFDIDAALKRKPELILVDELAHTNALGSRHPKRYSDIEELLQAGINVYTTVNVQHIESLRDVVASITRVEVNERIPDKVFDLADQVELVDIEVDDLIKRLQEGKIYRKDQAHKAMMNFFMRDNLVALREISLRCMADRINLKAEKEKQTSSTRFAKESILTCLSSSPSNAKVIRTASRMAKAFHGEFSALFVETPETKNMSQKSKLALQENLKLAKHLGAKVVSVFGEDIASQIAEYAKISGANKVVLGRSASRKGLLHRKNSFVDSLTSLAPNLDIYIIPDHNVQEIQKLKPIKVELPKINSRDVCITLLSLLMCTLIGLWFQSLNFSESNIIMMYILGILCISIATTHPLYGVFASIAGVALFNFFFTVPFYTFKADGSQYPITFLIMLFVSFITSTLTQKRKQQAQASAIKAHRTEILLDTSQNLQLAKSMEEISQESCVQLYRLLERTIIMYQVHGVTLQEPTLFNPNITEQEKSIYTSANEQAVAHWVYKNNRSAGVSTSTLSAAAGLYLAIRSEKKVFAVIGIAMDPKEELPVFERSLLSAMLNEIGLAMEKFNLLEENHKTNMQAERERLRANLLRAISHDLRTPLTTISGNANILLNSSSTMEEDTKVRLYGDILEDSLWLVNLVENLLSVTRIENGAMDIHMEGELLMEVIGEALQHISRQRVHHHIEVDIQDDMIMAKMDAHLIIQVIINIIDNAIKYTEEGSHIKISSFAKKDKAVIEIGDDGNGIADVDKERLFDMFFTSKQNKGDSRRGLGLGLSLCKSIIEAHGGEIYIRDNQPKGTILGFTLQLQEVIHNES